MLLAASSLALGCGETGTSMSGTVTYDGQPVTNGAITLVPQDGGPTVGAPINNGTYRITNVAPGKHVVQIVGFEKVPLVTSSAELEALSRAGTVPPVAREIPADAQGNHVEIDIPARHHQQDFQLMPP